MKEQSYLSYVESWHWAYEESENKYFQIIIHDDIVLWQAIKYPVPSPIAKIFKLIEFILRGELYYITFWTYNWIDDVIDPEPAESWSTDKKDVSFSPTYK